MIPTAPMTLPSAGALRRGRKTRRWARRPRKQAMRRASVVAGRLPMRSAMWMRTGMFGLLPGMMSTQGITSVPDLVSSS